jgi:hypothetical protein
MTQTEKNCTNCYWHNNGCPSTGEVCNGLSMWQPKACDYWNGEECTFDHGACDSQVETDYSHKIQGLIFSRYAELFTNYTFIDHETAIDLMAGEILTLRKELQQHKEALRLACQQICFHGHDCPAESVSNFDTFECKDTCDIVGQKPFDCWIKYFLIEAKGG